MREGDGSYELAHSMTNELSAFASIQTRLLDIGHDRYHLLL